MTVIKKGQAISNMDGHNAKKFLCGMESTGPPRWIGETDVFSLITEEKQQVMDTVRQQLVWNSPSRVTV